MLNGYPMIVRVSNGTQPVLMRTIMGWQGELAISTDTLRLFYCPTTEAPFVLVQTLDLAVCMDDQVVCNNDEIVYTV